MPKYFFRAKKSPHETIEDTIMADNKKAAMQKISEKGLFLLTIEEYLKSKESTRKETGIFKGKVKLKDITNFTRQLSDLLESGLTIVKALDVLYQQTENRRLKEIILDIRDYCMDGNPLSSALSRHPRIFSNLFTSMVASGEAGGALGIMLMRIADFNDRQLEIETKVRSALAYPILMSIVGFITILVLLTFVIPKMMTLFGDLGQNLPLPTLILIRINKILTHYWWMVIAVIASIFFLILRVYRTKEGRISFDRIKLNMPVIGNLTKKIEIARFARTLATLLNNGVPILEALRVVGETIDNAVIKEEIRKAAIAVKEGSNVAGGFAKSKIMPVLVINMMAVGEEGGQLEKALFKVAQGYERESDSAIKIMMSLLEPAMILILGAIVGFIVIAMLLPIFEINFLAR